MHQPHQDPISEQFRLGKNIRRPVSQIIFEILGQEASASVIRKATEWMRSKNPAIPIEARDGSPFDIGGGGISPAKSIILQSDQQTIWAALFDDPDKNTAGRTWIVELTVASKFESAVVGVRLFVIARSDDQFSSSVPSFVSAIISDEYCYRDSFRLSTRPMYINSVSDCEGLIDFLEKPDRRLPAIVCCVDKFDKHCAPPEILSKKMPGAAHVFSLSQTASKELARKFGASLSTPEGSARLYRPGFSSTKGEPYEHPIWTKRSGLPVTGRIHAIVNYVLHSSVSNKMDDYPRFDQIRQIVSKGAIETARQNSTDQEMIRLFEAENMRLSKDLESLRTEYDQWLLDTEASTRIAERELSELRSQLRHARLQNDYLRSELESRNSVTYRVPLENYESFEKWIQSNLSANIWISPKAIKNVEKQGNFRDPLLLSQILWMLDDLYVPMRKNPGSDYHRLYNDRLVELGCSDQPCFANQATVRSFPEYAVTYHGNKYWCEDHIKYGSGMDSRNFVRIYYHWHKEDEILIIGHMPTHLDNKLTN